MTDKPDDISARVREFALALTAAFNGARDAAVADLREKQIEPAGELFDTGTSPHFEMKFLENNDRHSDRIANWRVSRPGEHLGYVPPEVLNYWVAPHFKEGGSRVYSAVQPEGELTKNQVRLPAVLPFILADQHYVDCEFQLSDRTINAIRGGQTGNLAGVYVVIVDEQGRVHTLERPSEKSRDNHVSISEGLGVLLSHMREF